jgi:tetratricopeptide (TPR) repeat protein
MRVAVIFIAASLSTTVLAQQPLGGSPANSVPSQAAASCGNGSVDEYLAAKKKARRVRNKNPLPSDVCIGGWCRPNPERPPSDRLPTSHPPTDTGPDPSSDESSSKPVLVEGPTCDVYTAVQDVEVGDFYYGDKNYHAALARYESAMSNKPGDPGIFLRLGKTAEKLGDSERAKREYQASVEAAPDGPTAKESKSGLSRLASKSAK